MRVFQPASVLAVSVSLAGCAVNPFIASYSGRREAPAGTARVVDVPPGEGTARELGSSEFLSSSSSDGTAEALAAAADVGADLVMVTKSEATTEDWARHDDVYRRRASGQGQFSSYVPLPGSRERWKFAARFWRTAG